MRALAYTEGLEDPSGRGQYKLYVGSDGGEYSSLPRTTSLKQIIDTVSCACVCVCACSLHVSIKFVVMWLQCLPLPAALDTWGQA